MLNIIAGVFSEPTPPSPVSGATLWLDAADASTFTYSSGTVVSKWKDKSSNAYEFVNTTVANQPNRDTTQNGYSTVRFDGSNDHLYNDGQNKSDFKYLHNGSGATLFVVSKHNSTASAERVVLGTMQNRDANVGFYLDYFYPLLKMFTATGAGGLNKFVENEPTFVNNTWEVRTTRFDQNNATSSLKQLAYVNLGAAASPTVGASWTGASTADSTGYLSIGAANSGAGIVYPFLGEIAEIIAFNSVLNDTNKTSIIDYLMAKWGI
jgi:hypothetical protein